MYLFQGIFGEPEILEMNKEFWLALEGVMDDKVAQRVKEFWKQADSLNTEGSSTQQTNAEPSSSSTASTSDSTSQPNALRASLDKLLLAKVEESKELIGEAVKRHTFHLEVQDRQIYSKISNLFTSNILYTTEDREQLEEDLIWLIDNKHYWKVFIDTREKEAWQDFLQACIRLNETVAARAFHGHWKAFGIQENRKLIPTLEDNKEAFYKPNEKRRSTRMDLLFKRSAELEYMLHGLQFDKEYTKENNTGFYHRRSF